MDIKSLYIEELKTLTGELGMPVFGAAQLYDWMHKKLVGDYDSMTNLSKKSREVLKCKYPLTTLKLVRHQESKRDETVKYLFELSDGNTVESVFMPYSHGNSVCISSQVGCRMGCSFCASTLDGLERGLLPSEMLEQVYEIERRKGRISNVVVMGTGEPLDNYESLVRFVRLLTSPEGQNISGRSITVSTCGLADKIRRLADEGLSITLALSLHAPNDELRQQIMPVAKSFSIKELMDACGYYFAATGRRITFEYSLMENVNDDAKAAMELSALAKSLGAHVNLIPVNPVKERKYTRSKPEKIRAFKDRLEKNGINVTIRREMGGDIDGACGQLRRRAINEKLQKG